MNLIPCGDLGRIAGIMVLHVNKHLNAQYELFLTYGRPAYRNEARPQ